MDELELTLSSEDGEYVRSAWLVEGPPTARSLGVLLDGEHYRDGVRALPVFSALMEEGHIPPMTLVFVSHAGAAARHADYVGVPAFARFVAEEVVARVRERVPRLAPEGHLIAGLSLSGLAAAHIGVLYPSLFPAALCQSGSFWHEPDAFARLVQERPPRASRFWLSVGDQETAENVSHPPSGLFQGMSQIAGVERARAALEAAGADVTYHRYAGGHAYEPWRAELGDALRWLRRAA